MNTPVPSFVFALGAVIAVLYRAVFTVAVGVAVLAALSWAVRTRRVSPFGGVGQFVRSRVDPLFAPMERRLVRAGGLPTNAPWWTLAATVVGGMLLLYSLQFVLGLVLSLLSAASQGSGPLVLQLVGLTFGVLQLALFVRVLSSWFGLSPYSPWVRWAFTLTDWIINPLRQVVPSLGMFDITPIVAYFALILLQQLVVTVLAGALR